MAKKDLESELLRLLEADARTSISVLAAKLGVSRSTVRSRMEKLENDGTIQGYTLRYTDEYKKNRVRAHVMLSFAAKDWNHVERALRKLMGIQSIYSLTGDFDLLAIVEVDNTTMLDEFLNAIWAIEGVEHTLTAIILATRFKR